MQRPYLFEEGVYDAYARSVVTDYDLNIVDQFVDSNMSWMVTSTLNHPDFESNGITSYLWPFYLYEKLYLSSVLSDEHVAPSFILANIFYIMLAVLVFFKIFEFYKIKHFWKSLFTVFSGTTVTWMLFFVTTNTNIFALSYSILSLLLLSTKNTSYLNFFFIGMFVGLGAAIRIQLLWPVVVLLLFFVTYRRIDKKRFIIFGLGVIIPVSLLIINTYIKQGHLGHPLMLYLNYEPFGFFAIEHLKQSIFGPNSYFYIYPTFFIVLMGGMYSYAMSGKVEKKYHIIFIVPVITIFIMTIFIWPNQTGLIGRDLLSYSFIFIYFISRVYELVSKQNILVRSLSNFVIIGFVLISMYHVLIYMYYDYTSWQTWVIGNLDLTTLHHNFISHISSSVIHQELLYSFYIALKFLPLLAVGSVILSYVYFSMTSLKAFQNIAVIFIVFGVMSYGSITLLNIVFNKSNIVQLQQQDFFKGKVIGTSISAYIYDDFKEVYGLTANYYLSRDKGCERLDMLTKKIFIPYINSVYSSISYDPIHFRLGLQEKKYRLSNLEDERFVLQLASDIREKCNF